MKQRTQLEFEGDGFHSRPEALSRLGDILFVAPKPYDGKRTKMRTTFEEIGPHADEYSLQYLLS